MSLYFKLNIKVPNIVHSCQITVMFPICWMIQYHVVEIDQCHFYNDIDDICLYLLINT